MEHEDKSIVINFKTLSTVVGSAVAILGGIWAIDNHYAAAADVVNVQRTMETQVRQLRQERVEDELFKLDIKRQTQGGKLDPIDAALHDRYSRRLQQTKEEELKVNSIAVEKK